MPHKEGKRHIAIIEKRNVISIVLKLKKQRNGNGYKQPVQSIVQWIECIED